MRIFSITTNPITSIASTIGIAVDKMPLRLALTAATATMAMVALAALAATATVTRRDHPWTISFCLRLRRPHDAPVQWLPQQYHHQQVQAVLSQQLDVELLQAAKCPLRHERRSMT